MIVSQPHRPLGNGRLAWTALAVTVAVVSPAQKAAAQPAVAGTRNLGMADASRSSSVGAQGIRTNPASLSFSNEFGVDVAYQVSAQERSHGLGLSIGDSLNNPRFGLAVAYTLIRAKPRVEYTLTDGESSEHSLDRQAHEIAGIASVVVVPKWLYLGAGLKYLRNELTFETAQEETVAIQEKTNKFGLDLGLSLELLGFVRGSFVAYNLVGYGKPAYTEDKGLTLPDLPDRQITEPIAPGGLTRLAYNPRMIAHGLSIFPTRKPEFNLNFDGVYDFSTYEASKDVRLGYSASAEYVLGPVPIRAGFRWDGRGPGKADDQTHLAAGVGFVKPTNDNRAGVLAGIAFSQQLSGPQPRVTTLSASLTVTFDPGR